MKLDRYAGFDIGRDRRLSVSERHALYVLVMRADFRTREWAGTITDLADDLGATRRTAARVLSRLRELGLVEVITPFLAARQGCLRVAVYDLLVVPERNAKPRAAHAPIDAIHDPADFVSTPRGARATTAPNGARRGRITSTKARTRGSEAAREGGSSRTHASAVALLTRELSAVEVCTACGETANGERGPDGSAYCKRCEVF